MQAYSVQFSRKIYLEKSNLTNKVVVIILALSGAILQKISYRAFTLVAKICGLIIGKGNMCAVEMSSDTKFVCDLGDFYWNRLVCNQFNYEPEMFSLLDLFAKTDYVFIDCGANFGFWSLLVSSNQFGNKDVISVEAVPETFNALKHNVSFNRRTINIFNSGIFDESNKELTIYKGASHAGASFNKQWIKGSNKSETAIESIKIQTITIDDLLTKVAIPLDKNIVLKLDVEGVEINALKGFKTNKNRKALIIFEEYGGNKDANIADFVMNEMGLKVFFINENSKMLQICNIEEVISLKKNKTQGYNFIATSTDSVFYEILKSKISLQ